jgi:hypothetical protein
MSDLRAPLGNLKPFFGKLAKLRDRNLNKKQEIFRWWLFSLSTAQDKG